MKILVTGGAGYIGSHTVVELHNAGYEIIVADNLSNSSIEILDNLEKIIGIKPEFVKVDLANAVETDNFFNNHNSIKAIIHFAASKAVGESVEKPLMYYKNNINSLVNVLSNMEKHGIKNLVFSSSCTVYGQPDILPVVESTPRKPAESPYGNTKTICEDIIRDVCKAQSSTNAIALRYFNPIGAHPSSLIGELPNGVPSNLIPYLTQTAAGVRDCLSVFGDDYNTPDGTAIRDFINVVDLAQAHVIAIERLVNAKQDSNFEFFNIGTGEGYSVMQLINAFIKATKVKLNYKIVPRRAGDIEKIWADTTISSQKLGWKTKISLEDSLLSSWNWEKRLRGIK